MMKAVAYYRTRPGEPAASELALSRQREAVQREVEENGIDLVAEFIEREGEEGSDGCPAYIAALRAVSAHSRGEGFIDVMLIIAAQAAIGAGEPFREPKVDSTGAFMTTYLQVRSIPASPEIELPAGAPGSLCLYADCRPGQLDTSIYLCNAGPDSLAAVVVKTHTINEHQFFSSPPGEERWAEESRTGEQSWDAMLPSRCMLVASLDHCLLDYVSRYRVFYTDAAGRRWEAEAHDVNMNACNLADDQDRVWAAFGPAREVADQPTSKRHPDTNEDVGYDQT